MYCMIDWFRFSLFEIMHLLRNGDIVISRNRERGRSVKYLAQKTDYDVSPLPQNIPVARLYTRKQTLHPFFLYIHPSIHLLKYGRSWRPQQALWYVFLCNDPWPKNTEGKQEKYWHVITFSLNRPFCRCRWRQGSHEHSQLPS